MPVSLTNEQTLPIRTRLLRKVARQLLANVQLENGQVDLLLTNDEAVQSLNYEYRGFDKATDVLSFAQRDAVEGAPDVPHLDQGPIILGDVVISVDTALRQAEEHGVSLEQELALLTVHGMLHLLGYEDETEAGAIAMHARERELLGFTFPSAAIPG